MVGQTGRRQAITLAQGCWRNGIVAHEIGKWRSLSELHVRLLDAKMTYANGGVRMGHPKFFHMLLYCHKHRKICFHSCFEFSQTVNSVSMTL